jgi:hypothetical protein
VGRWASPFLPLPLRRPRTISTKVALSPIPLTLPLHTSPSRLQSRAQLRARVLVLLAVARRRWAFFWFGFALLSSVDAIATLFWITGQVRPWLMEAFFAPFGLVSIPITIWCVRHWPESDSHYPTSLPPGATASVTETRAVADPHGPADTDATRASCAHVSPGWPAEDSVPHITLPSATPTT